MDFVVVQALTGLAGASSLFLVAAGLTVIFGVTRVVNFAHGSLYMLGAYIGWSILTRLPRDPAWFAAGVLLAALATAALGALLEMGLLRRIYRAPELLQLLATFGVVLMVQDAALYLWGPDELTLPRPPWLRGFVAVAGSRFPLFDLVLIGVGPLVLGLLWLGWLCQNLASPGERARAHTRQPGAACATAAAPLASAEPGPPASHQRGAPQAPPDQPERGW